MKNPTEKLGVGYIGTTSCAPSCCQLTAVHMTAADREMAYGQT